MKKGCRQLIYVSDFVEEENGCLIIRDQEGIMQKDAQCITYLGSGGDLWWDHAQLLMQVKWAISIFEEAHPDCIGVFLFDHLSVLTSLRPDSLRVFEINKSNGEKQRKQKDTTIPMNNPDVECHGKLQKMTTEAGEPKGLQQTLEERGFSIHGMHMKCTPVCPFKNNDCCMAQLLSKQDDFWNQESLLKQRIKVRGHHCVFLPKFHYELNPIEMVCLIHFYSHVTVLLNIL